MPTTNMPPIIRCDGKFDFLFYDIKAQLFPEDHAISCQVEFSIRNLVDNTSSLILTLLPPLEISRRPCRLSIRFPRVGDQGPARLLMAT